MKIARIVGLIGRFLVLSGLLLLFYTSYLLWGTGVYTKNAQRHFQESLRTNPLVTAPAANPGEIPPAKPADQPKAGQQLFTIVIQKIGLRTVVVEGVEPEQLKLGPGHFPGKPWPGEKGNVAISGHRTTFGAPFFKTNELETGDRIAIESGPYRNNYSVTEKLIVAPTEVGVVENRGRDELTLTSCHPRFSAAQRLIIHARYDGPELIAATAPQAVQEGKVDVTLVPPPAAVPEQTVVLGFLAVMSALGAVALTERFRLTALWAAFAVFAGVGLWTQVFPEVLKLMPSNY